MNKVNPTTGKDGMPAWKIADEFVKEQEPAAPSTGPAEGGLRAVSSSGRVLHEHLKMLGLAEGLRVRHRDSGRFFTIEAVPEDCDTVRMKAEDGDSTEEITRASLSTEYVSAPEEKQDPSPWKQIACCMKDARSRHACTNTCSIATT